MAWANICPITQNQRRTDDLTEWGRSMVQNAVENGKKYRRQLAYYERMDRESIKYPRIHPSMIKRTE